MFSFKIDPVHAVATTEIQVGPLVSIYISYRHAGAVCVVPVSLDGRPGEGVLERDPGPRRVQLLEARLLEEGPRLDGPSPVPVLLRPARLRLGSTAG